MHVLEGFFRVCLCVCACHFSFLPQPHSENFPSKASIDIMTSIYINEKLMFHHFHSYDHVGIATTPTNNIASSECPAGFYFLFEGGGGRGAPWHCRRPPLSRVGPPFQSYGLLGDVRSSVGLRKCRAKLLCMHIIPVKSMCQ